MEIHPKLVPTPPPPYLQEGGGRRGKGRGEERGRKGEGEGEGGEARGRTGKGKVKGEGERLIAESQMLDYVPPTLTTIYIIYYNKPFKTRTVSVAVSLHVDSLVGESIECAATSTTFLGAFL